MVKRSNSKVKIILRRFLSLVKTTWKCPKWMVSAKPDDWKTRAYSKFCPLPPPWSKEHHLQLYKKGQNPYSAIISEAQGTILTQRSPPLAQNLPRECLVGFNINRHLLKWIICFPYDLFIIMAWLDLLPWGSNGRLGKENFRVDPNCRMSHFAYLLLFDQAKG